MSNFYSTNRPRMYYDDQGRYYGSYGDYGYDPSGGGGYYGGGYYDPYSDPNYSSGVGAGTPTEPATDPTTSRTGDGSRETTSRTTASSRALNEQRNTLDLLRVKDIFGAQPTQPTFIVPNEPTSSNSPSLLTIVLIAALIIGGIYVSQRFL